MNFRKPEGLLLANNTLQSNFSDFFPYSRKFTPMLLCGSSFYTCKNSIMTIKQGGQCKMKQRTQTADYWF